MNPKMMSESTKKVPSSVRLGGPDGSSEGWISMVQALRAQFLSLVTADALKWCVFGSTEASHISHLPSPISQSRAPQAVRVLRSPRFLSALRGHAALSHPQRDLFQHHQRVRISTSPVKPARNPRVINTHTHPSLRERLLTVLAAPSTYTLVAS